MEYCARARFVEQVQDGALSPQEQADAYDAATARCRRAIAEAMKEG